MLLDFDRHFKTFYNALKIKLKNHRGNWNQNDPTADDYIKNRTHWVDDDGTVHTLDEKYLPDMSSMMKVTVYENENGNLVADKTYEEIAEAILNGTTPYVVAYGKNLWLTSSPVLDEVSTFDLVNQHKFTMVEDGCMYEITIDDNNNCSVTFENMASQSYVENFNFITVEDIDAICGTTIQLADETTF